MYEDIYCHVCGEMVCQTCGCCCNPRCENCSCPESFCSIDNIKLEEKLKDLNVILSKIKKLHNNYLSQNEPFEESTYIELKLKELEAEVASWKKSLHVK